MGHSVQVWVRSSSGRVIFGLSDVWSRFGLGRIWFGSGQPIFGQIQWLYQTSDFVENLGSSMVRFGSIRVSCPLSGEYISGVGQVWVRLIGSSFESRVSFDKSNFLGITILVLGFPS